MNDLNSQQDPEEGIGNSHAALQKHPGGVPAATEVPPPGGPAAPQSPTATEDMLPMGEGEKSVLQAKLTNLAIQIGYAGMAVSLLTVVILCIKYSIKNFVTEGKPWDVSHINFYVRFIIIGVTVLVVAVPE